MVDQIKQEQTWRQGKLLEVSDYYSIMGKFLFKGSLKNGNGSYFEYHPEGEIKLKASLQNGLFSELYKGYHINNKLAFEGKMVLGLRQGLWSFYQLNGNISATGYYIDSEKLGQWKEYSKRGRLLKTIKY